MRIDGALVALSGGVDSSYALNLCVERYRSVRAGYVDTSGDGIPPHAEKAAAAAGVELVRVDAAEKFDSEIVQWSAKMFSDGMTPNPCARCNARVKLLALHDIMLPSETLVTGHYARMDGGLLKRGVDKNKDQSYFLSLVSGEILKDCTFPLGGMLKEDVYREATRLNIPFREKESMDLCFSLNDPVVKAGRILNMQGNEIGRHEGVDKFTVGQRKGLGAFGQRMYVVALDSSKRTVTAGTREDLLATACSVVEMNWLRKPSSFPAVALVQTRYRRKAVRAVIDYTCGNLHIEFSRPEEAVAPGQVCAVYLSTSVIGGGIISSTEQPDRKSDGFRTSQ